VCRAQITVQRTAVQGPWDVALQHTTTHHTTMKGTTANGGSLKGSEGAGVGQGQKREI
jgi:hypothetical protein